MATDRRKNDFQLDYTQAPSLFDIPSVFFIKLANFLAPLPAAALPAH
jgi:hypothetical protein